MVTSLIALIMAVAVAAMTSSLFVPVYAQAGGAQEESEGDLQVVINGEQFTTGQTIIISGSIDDPGPTPPHIQVVDPEGTVVVRTVPQITADDTFSYSFEAGGRDSFMLGDGPMTVSGNYRVTVTYMPSFTNIDEVNMEFEYIVTPVAEEPAPPTPAPVIPPTPAPAPTVSPPLNVTALGNMVMEGLEYVQELNFTLTRANASEGMLADLEAIQNTFQNIQGNLTGVTPLSQGEVLANNTTATAPTSQLQPPPQQQEQRPPAPPTSPQTEQLVL